MANEIRRQFIHLFFGSIIILLVALLGRFNALLLSSILFFSGLLTSYLIKKGIKIPLINLIIPTVERQHEIRMPGYGALLFLLGLILLLFFFPNEKIVIGALIVAVYGDAFSTIVGVTVGRTKTISPYTLEGTIGGIVASFFLLVPLFPAHIAFITAFIGMLAEIMPINDNLSIPIISAIVLTLLL